MRYVLAAAAALCFATSANAGGTFVDTNWITGITLTGTGFSVGSEENMCNIVTCTTKPDVISPFSFDITYKFQTMVSAIGWQQYYSHTYNFPDTTSIVNVIYFNNGEFVRAFGFRDSSSDFGCDYNTSMEEYLPLTFSSYSSYCSTPPGELPGFGIRTSHATYGDITSIRIDYLTYNVPEPATWGMMILGFGLIGVALRRARPLNVAR